MQDIAETFQLFIQAVTIFSWRDLVEIFCLSSIVYYFLVWLNQDLQKNLVLYFYSYCCLTFTAHYLDLTILSQSLLYVSPLVFCIFIILHQQSLQKNFLSLKKLSPEIQNSDHWVDELMRASLYAVNKSKSLIWVVERKDAVELTLQASCLFYANLKKDLIDLLLDTQTSEDTILWVNHAGKLVAINAQWNIRSSQISISPEIEQLPEWQRNAVLMSSKIDAIVIYSCSVTRLFTVVIQGKSIESMSAPQTALLLKRLLIHSSSFQEGISYAPQSPQASAQQRHT